MAQKVTPTNIQKMEYDVTTSEGAARVTVVCGTLSVTGAYGATGGRKDTVRALVDPTLQPGKFRRAVAMASLLFTTFDIATTPSNGYWAIDDVQATYDDETGQILLEVDIAVASSTGGTPTIQKIGFQVTTLAIVGTGQ